MFYQEKLVLVFFVMLKSVCDLRLSIIIGVIFLSFVLCFWDVNLVCLMWWCCCWVFMWVVLL